MQQAASTTVDNPIPGIDLGPYLRGEPGGLDAAARALREVCEDVGFFYIENHGIPRELIDRAFEASRRVHALPRERKEEIRLNPHNVGYMFTNESTQRHSKVAVNRKPNYNESFFTLRERGPDHPDVVSEKPFCAMNRWPRDLPGFREDTLAYQDAMEALALKVVPVVARALGLPDGYMDEYFDVPYLQVRMLHYPPRDESDPEQFGAGAHTDAGFLTFLMQREVGGLQIRRTDGVWIDAPVMPYRFLINTGDMMRRWTNERFLSTPHRVMNVSGTDRYSIAFFFSPNLDRELACLPTCQGPGNPPKYPPISYGAYKMEFVTANYGTNPLLARKASASA
jgi:isopenicillin N synthase-like dioxygenase